MSSRDKSIKVFFSDILAAIQKIETYTQNMTYDRFITDERTIDAVIRNLEVIGEASKNIPTSFKENCHEINWKAISGMRDKLIHEYFGVSLPIVWETIREDLSALKNIIEKILNELGEGNR